MTLLIPAVTHDQVAAGTLDASTKIYAVRVDAVHADAYRVLGGLGSETKPGEGERWGHPRARRSRQPECGVTVALTLSSGRDAEEADGEADDTAGETAVKQVVKKKRAPKRTVEANLSNINSSESERKCEV